MGAENKNIEQLEIEIDEIIDNSEDYETKRTIDEVLDKETGEIIKSVDFFKKPESEIVLYRRQLAEVITGYANSKFVCSYCGQLLKLSGRQTRRGQVDFFAHLYDSDDCEIKTNGEVSKEEIEARKYANIRESQRHIDLKAEIEKVLKGSKSQEMGIKNVEVEKRITSDVPYLYWRQPDVFAEFGDKNIVFELQLSTTFLSALVDRDIFYRLHNTYIVWIFNFSDNQEYVNLSNLMCKDIYYANKRNAFVFDDKARRLSKEEEQLVLLCIWFEPFIENGRFYSEKSIRKEEYIRLSDLKFDDEIYKPYYVDADSMFFKYQPELKINRINLEELNINRIRKTEKRRKDKEHLQKKKEEKINELKEQIQRGEVKLQRFQKKDKWGYECNGVTILEPTFSYATDMSEEGFAVVQKSKKYGLINQTGKFILNCDYKELTHIFINQFIINRRNEWFCINSCTKEECFIHKSKDKNSSIQLEKISNTAYIVRVEDIVGVLHETYLFREYDSISSFGSNGLATAERGGRWKSGYSSHNGSYWEYTPKKYIQGKTVYIEKTGEELISNKIEIFNNVFKGTKYDRWGVETIDKTLIIPFEYDEISEFINGKSKSKKDGNYGYVDEQGNTIIPFEYSEINKFVDGKAKAEKNGRWGYIDEQGNAVIPFEYSGINEFIGRRAKASKGDWRDKRYGYIDEQGNTIISFEYEEIDEFINGKAKAKKNGNWGCIDEQENIVIPCEYDWIHEFIDGKAKAGKNRNCGYIDEQGNEIIENEIELENGLIKGVKFGKWGCIDKQGNTVVSFEYDAIEEFTEGNAFS